MKRLLDHFRTQAQISEAELAQIEAQAEQYDQEEGAYPPDLLR